MRGLKTKDNTVIKTGNAAAPRRAELRGSLMLLITAVIWGSAFAAQSMGNRFMGPFTFNCARSLVGGVGLLLCLPFFDKFGLASPPRGKDEKKKLLLGGLVCGVILFAASSSQQIGMISTSAGKAGFITALYIVLVPVAGIFMGRKLSLPIWLSVATATAGMYLLCVNGEFTVGRGDIMVMLCAFFFTFHILTIDRLAPRLDCVRMSCIQFFVSGALSGICAAFSEPVSFGAVWDGRYAILYAGLLSSGVAYTLQMTGQKHTRPVVAALIMSLESVFAALTGVLVLNESFSPREIVGCVLILAAAVTAQLRDYFGKKNPAV